MAHIRGYCVWILGDRWVPDAFDCHELCRHHGLYDIVGICPAVLSLQQVHRESKRTVEDSLEYS